MNSSFNGLAGALSLVFVISQLKLGIGVEKNDENYGVLH